MAWPIKPQHPETNCLFPTTLYNAMVNPVIPYKIKGVTLPLMVNEEVSLAPHQPQAIRYEKQIKGRGTPK